MKVAEYLFKRINELGAGHVFGIPGDFAISLYKALDKSPLIPIITTHEPQAGFAADAYARMTGLGVVLVTYGAGALNTLNAIAQAYAEKSPVLLISGAPDLENRNPDTLLHHRVKTFNSQYEIYKEVTVAAYMMQDLSTAFEDINHVIDRVISEKRPGYIEIPRDMVNASLIRNTCRIDAKKPVDRSALDEAMEEITKRINKSKRPVVLAGVEIERFGLREKLIKIIKKYNFPVATSIVGKAVFPEHHKNFIGTYMGEASATPAQSIVEDSDCLIMLGAMMTDTNTGLFSSNIKRERVIHASSEKLAVSYHTYQEIGLIDIVNYLIKTDKIKKLKEKSKIPPKTVKKFKDNSPLETSRIFTKLSELPDGKYSIITDVGDCLFGCVNLNADIILNPGYYASMGFGVPGALGAALAAPERKPIALVGDGGFQMTGMEISTLIKHRIDAVIIIMNNGGYASLDALGGSADYFNLHSWDYVKIAQSIGAKGMTVRTNKEFCDALDQACGEKGVFLIDALLSIKDISEPLKKLRDFKAREKGK